MPRGYRLDAAGVHPYWPDWMLIKDGSATHGPSELLARRRQLGGDSGGHIGWGRHLLDARLARQPSAPREKAHALLPGWTGKGDGGVYAILHPGVPALPRGRPATSS